jgi:hypothetical protein
MRRVIGIGLTAMLASVLAQAHGVGPTPFRLTTDFRGPTMCLDVYNGGKFNNEVHMTKCGQYSGQKWTATPAAKGPNRRRENRVKLPKRLSYCPSEASSRTSRAGGTAQLLEPGKSDAVARRFADSTPTIWAKGAVTLTTEFRGAELCLDVTNGGNRNNFVHLKPCGNRTGQLWHVADAGGEKVRLTTEFRGAEMCLDLVNGGKLNDQARLTPCGSFTGQLWTAPPF